MEVAEGDEEVPVDAEVADEVFAEEEVELAAEEEDGEVLVPLDVAAADEVAEAADEVALEALEADEDFAPPVDETAAVEEAAAAVELDTASLAAVLAAPPALVLPVGGSLPRPPIPRKSGARFLSMRPTSLWSRRWRVKSFASDTEARARAMTRQRSVRVTFLGFEANMMYRCLAGRRVNGLTMVYKQRAEPSTGVGTLKECRRKER